MIRARKTEWAWIEPPVILAIHDEQLAEHGGREGLRDANGMDAALARPQQLAQYGRPDLASIAAAYGYGLARNHPFSDGNKRVAFVTMAVFLGLNGSEIDAPEAEVVTVMLDLAAGELTEEQLADWLRLRLVRADA